MSCVIKRAQSIFSFSQSRVSLSRSLIYFAYFFNLHHTGDAKFCTFTIAFLSSDISSFDIHYSLLKPRTADRRPPTLPSDYASDSSSTFECTINKSQGKSANAYSISCGNTRSIKFNFVSGEFRTNTSA